MTIAPTEMSARLHRLLDSGDRCDRCIQAAVGVATLYSGKELLFCGHHLRANRAALLADRSVASIDPPEIDPYTLASKEA